MLVDPSQLGLAPCRPRHKSWYNEQTAELGVQLACEIAGTSAKRTVAIITPYRAQSALLRSLLRAERELGEHVQRVEAGTVHQFQGSAADVVIFDVVEAEARKGYSQILKGDTGLRLVNVAATRAREKLIVVADRRWHERYTDRQQNPLLWQLVINRPQEQTIDAAREGQAIASSPVPYDSAYEAVLGDLLLGHAELPGMVPQHPIRRDDGSLISRADFAMPDLKYAVYVDGANWHLTESGWLRDRRLRGELRDMGWTVSVFGAHEVEASAQGCLAKILAQVRALVSRAHPGCGSRRRSKSAA